MSLGDDLVKCTTYRDLMLLFGPTLHVGTMTTSDGKAKLVVHNKDNSEATVDFQALAQKFNEIVSKEQKERNVTHSNLDDTVSMQVFKKKCEELSRQDEELRTLPEELRVIEESLKENLASAYACERNGRSFQSVNKALDTYDEANKILSQAQAALTDAERAFKAFQNSPFKDKAANCWSRAKKDKAEIERTLNPLKLSILNQDDVDRFIWKSEGPVKAEIASNERYVLQRQQELKAITDKLTALSIKSNKSNNEMQLIKDLQEEESRYKKLIEKVENIIKYDRARGLKYTSDKEALERDKKFTQTEADVKERRGEGANTIVTPYPKKILESGEATADERELSWWLNNLERHANATDKNQHNELRDIQVVQIRLKHLKITRFDLPKRQEVEKNKSALEKDLQEKKEALVKAIRGLDTTNISDGESRKKDFIDQMDKHPSPKGLGYDLRGILNDIIENVNDIGPLMRLVESYVQARENLGYSTKEDLEKELTELERDAAMRGLDMEWVKSS